MPDPECDCSLEVRWIFPGQLSTAVAAWFERYLAETESRDDAYLLAPHLRGLSVKLRGGGALLSLFETPVRILSESSRNVLTLLWVIPAGVGWFSVRQVALSPPYG